MMHAPEMYDGLNISYNVTEDCNLRCSYCYEVDKKPEDLPLDYAKAFTKIILDDPDPVGVLGTSMEWLLESGLILDFIGGDALMRPELVEDILKDFIFQAGARNHRWARRWRASISTNGTLFGNEKVRELLLKYQRNISLGVSVDGCPEIHNKLRSNSMDEILKNWNWYMDFAGPSASTKATLTKESIPYLPQSLKFLHEDLGLQRINMNFIFEDMGLTEDDLVEFDQKIAECVDYVLQHRGDLYWSMIDDRFVSPPPGDPNKGWCGAGAMPCLSVNGKIYPCFRFMPHTMHDRQFDLPVGDVWNGINRKENFCLVRNQTRGKISEEKCRSCEIDSQCAWCIGSSFAESGAFYRQTNICEVMKVQAKWAKEYWRIYGNT